MTVKEVCVSVAEAMEVMSVKDTSDAISKETCIWLSKDCCVFLCQGDYLLKDSVEAHLFTKIGHFPVMLLTEYNLSRFISILQVYSK